MARLPAQNEIVGGMSPRQKVWAQIRKNREGFTQAQIAEHGKVSEDAVKDYVKVLLKAGFIAVIDSEVINAVCKRSLPVEVWQNLAGHLNDAVPYLDTVDQALIYVFDVPNGLGKMVVRVNYKEKARFDGVRDRITSNFIRTGGIFDQRHLDKEKRFVRLEK